MKVTLIANISANGKVLLAENSSYQAPQAAIIEFMSIATKAGNYVMGRKTFEMLEGEFVNIKAAFQGIELVILSEGGSISKEFKVVAHPNEAIKHLSEKGF
jgi:dihydrofolate reductase